MRSSSHGVFIVVSALLLATLAAIRWLPFHPAASYTILFLTGSLLFLEVARRLFHVDAGRNVVVSLIALSFLVRISFLDRDPVGSDDVYRYVWDGKVQAAGIDPYRYAPDASELNQLHSANLPALVNHPSMRTVYFPLTQWIFRLGYEISGESLWGQRLLVIAAELAAVAGILVLLGLLGIPSKFAILYALSPLAIYSFGLDVHLDAFGIALLVWSLVFHRRGKLIPALVLAGLSIGVKPVAVLLLPFFFINEASLLRRALVLLIPAVTFALPFAPYAGSPHIFESLGIFATHWTFNGALFEVVDSFISNNQTTRTVCGLAFLLGLVLLYRFRIPGYSSLHYSLLILLLCSPVVHSWYVTWLAALLPMARRWSGIVYTSTVSLTAFTVLAYQTRGSWTEYPLAMVIEYLPVFVLLLLELRRIRDPAPGEPGA